MGRINTIHYYLLRGIKKFFKQNMVKNSKIDEKAQLSFNIQLVDCKLGKYSYIGEHSCAIGTDIGKYCSIADNCIIGAPAHPMEFVSTSPVFLKGRNIFGTNLGKHTFTEYIKTTIESDVWIGSSALIKAGVHVGVGAVIGMGAVVTHDIGPYEIWAGNPAKMIRKRFPNEMCEKLITSEWWEYTDEKIRKYVNCMDSPQVFCKEVNKKDGKI